MAAIDELKARLGDRYHIEGELGRGGMGTVYLARDRRLDRPVALKVLPMELAAGALRDRFVREMRMAASFSHPNIVPVYAVEESGDLLAYAMAYVEGENLAERVRRSGPLGIRDTVRLLQDAGYALAYAHGRGVVHRDIKPENVMIERATGRAMVMDFGIARAIAAPAPGTEGLTRIGEVVGTPEYMSPEQATGDEVDGRSDLYALGLTALFALTGRPAISGDSTGKVLARQITEVLPSTRSMRSDVPSALGDAIDRCVAKDPAERFQTAESLVEELDAARLAGPEIPLAIRMFQQESASLSTVIFFGAFVIWLLMLLADNTDSDDMMLPATILVAVLFTRVMQTMREAARLAASGFGADEIHRGLAAVMAERDQRRAELRADERTRRARRKTLYMVGVMLVGALWMTWGAFRYRHPRPGGGYQVDPPGMILIFNAMILFGVSLALGLRSPFRMPAGERVYRWVWLGPVGRLFVSISGRRAWRDAAKRPRLATPPPMTASRAATPPPVSIPPDATARVTSLEQRVAELERWRSVSS